MNIDIKIDINQQKPTAAERQEVDPRHQAVVTALRTQLAGKDQEIEDCRGVIGKLQKEVEHLKSEGQHPLNASIEAYRAGRITQTELEDRLQRAFAQARGAMECDR